MEMAIDRKGHENELSLATEGNNGRRPIRDGLPSICDGRRSIRDGRVLTEVLRVNPGGACLRRVVGGGGLIS
jgi:hypothetical protein